MCGRFRFFEVFFIEYHKLAENLFKIVKKKNESKNISLFMILNLNLCILHCLPVGLHHFTTNKQQITEKSTKKYFKM